jgi:hypothetical protein
MAKQQELLRGDDPRNIVRYDDPHLILGPRLAVEIRARVRVLENRFRGTLTNAERRELSRLHELLVIAKDGGSNAS